MAPSIADTIRYVVAQLATLGLRAAADPGDLPDLPGVLVYPNTASWDALSGDVLDLTVDLLLAASGVGSLAAIGQLETMLDALRVPFGVTEARAVTLNLPSLTNGGDPVPAFQITITLRVVEDEE